MENDGDFNHHAKRRGKTVEEIYQKKTQLEHILLRPDTYVGSCEHQLEEKWVFDAATEDQPAQMNFRRIDYVPALYKIFDEILVNAADHLIRDPKGMNTIEVNIKAEENMISVYNNGAGLPVCIHKEHKVYIPEMLFGHLLTGDNYDDAEKKIVGGRNGFGAKLTNVFSTRFKLETLDASSKKYYCQEFSDNMSVIHSPEIKSSKQSPFTRVTFWPDLAKFGMEELDTDMVAMMTKRVLDIAGTTGSRCKVFLNGKRLGVDSFLEYVKIYLKLEEPVHEVCSDRWEIAFAVSPQEQFQQVSFVNSICTTKGGTHVTHVTEQLVETLMKKVKAKNKGGMEIKPAHIRNHLWVFVKSLIENPAFDSQTKDTLTTKQSKFGSKCDISDQFVSKVVKSGVIEQIIMWAKAKEQVSLKKLKGSANTQRVMGVQKLDDANDAGTKNGHLCTLILTEGDSAKSLAIAGISVLGRDRYGAFPLRGKVLNVRDASHKMITGNNEIQAILKTVGLQPNKQYSSLQELRYGSIMIMADQDYDGSHIKGLLINFFDYWWPNLLQDHPGFLKEFITPIVKATKNSSKQTSTFYTMPEYEIWKNAHKHDQHTFTIKYYKGLGTSTAKEAKEYFSNLDKHRVEFVYDDNTKESIDLAFNKKRADDRKNWINGYTDGDCVDTSSQMLSYTDFVNKELVLFSKYNLQRSIPSMVDGFKTSQRKIMFASFKKKLKKDLKVAQLVGYIGEKAAYHHGEVSLANGIVNMAQNYVGSNNINLLVPSGQFGTRMQGGNDASSSRYIFTRLCDYTRCIFNPADDHILTYLEEEGQSIEPEWYCPIIPMILVNGAEGIGTGWATSIPNYNPLDIIANLRRALRNKPMTKMEPWFKNFVGSIFRSEKEVGKFDCVGRYEKISSTMIEITELPVRKWTTEYKENVLQALMPGAPAKKDEKGKDLPARDPLIEDYRDYSTESKAHFAIKLSEDQMEQVEAQGLEKVLKLKTSINETNMMLFDVDGKIRKYEDANEIMDDFFDIRLKMYDKRKEFQMAQLTREKLFLDERVRFILLVIDKKIELRNAKKADLIAVLKDKFHFKTSSTIKNTGVLSTMRNTEPKKKDGDDEDDADEEEPEAKKKTKGDYDYLLGMPMWNLTLEIVEEMKKLRQKKIDEIDILQATSIESLWDRDLAELQVALSKAWAEEDKDEQLGIEAAEKARRGNGKPIKTAKGKGRGKGGPVKKVTVTASDEFFTPTATEIQPRTAWTKFNSPVETVNRVERPKPVYAPPVSRSQKLATAIKLDEEMPSAEPASSGSRNFPVEENNVPPAKRPRRELKTRGAKKEELHSDPPEPAPEPAQETHASYLQRMLSRRNARMTSLNLSAPTSSTHTALGGTDDLFGFGSSLDLTKPYTFDLSDDALLLPSAPASSSKAPDRLRSESTVEILDTQPVKKSPPKRNPRKRVFAIDDDDD